MAHHTNSTKAEGEIAGAVLYHRGVGRLPVYEQHFCVRRKLHCGATHTLHADQDPSSQMRDHLVRVSCRREVSSGQANETSHFPRGLSK